MEKGFVVTGGELVDIQVHELRQALENILEACNGYVGSGPLNTIVDIANDALGRKKVDHEGH